MTLIHNIPAAAIALCLALTSPALALSPFAGVPSPWHDAVATDTGETTPIVSTKEAQETPSPMEQPSR